MKAVGIIAEYNPFHNGHLYHLTQIKKKYPDHIIVLVMSGNFMQRGNVAIIDKQKRTEIALMFGIDLVVELPYPFATQSADFFSYGAITILEKLKVEKIIFGSESDNIDDLKLIAETQLNNEDFDKLIKIYSKLGLSYPNAISSALFDLTNKKINTPNDLLGISYIKTIIENKYIIQAETIKRINNYHSKELEDSFASGTAIREAIKENKDVYNYIPKEVIPFLDNFYFIDDYFYLLKYIIITTKDLSIFHTVDEGIDKVLKREIVNAMSFHELVTAVKSKRYTYNKICRMLIHILCNFTKEKAKLFQDVSYIRILGLNDNGKIYLNSIKKKIDIPIISKIRKEKDPMLEFELETTQIYNIKRNNLINREFEKIIYKGE